MPSSGIWKPSLYHTENTLVSATKPSRLMLCNIAIWRWRSAFYWAFFRQSLVNWCRCLTKSPRLRLCVQLYSILVCYDMPFYKNKNYRISGFCPLPGPWILKKKSLGNLTTFYLQLKWNRYFVGSVRNRWLWSLDQWCNTLLKGPSRISPSPEDTIRFSFPI
jgi:hypothetical protein